MTSAQSWSRRHHWLEPTSSMLIFKPLNLVIYKTLTLAFSVLLTECLELLLCKIPGWSRHVFLSKSRRFESTDFVSVMIDDCDVCSEHGSRFSFYQARMRRVVEESRHVLHVEYTHRLVPAVLSSHWTQSDHQIHNNLATRGLNHQRIQAKTIAVVSATGSRWFADHVGQPSIMMSTQRKPAAATPQRAGDCQPRGEDH